MHDVRTIHIGLTKKAKTFVKPALIIFPRIPERRNTDIELVTKYLFPDDTILFEYISQVLLLDLTTRVVFTDLMNKEGFWLEEFC